MIGEMNRFDNYVFYAICEKTYEHFSVTKFSNYILYCNYMKNTFLLENFSRKEMFALSVISKHLNHVYGLNIEEGMEYIIVFFLEDKFLRFEEAVRLMKKHFAYL